MDLQGKLELHNKQTVVHGFGAFAYQIDNDAGGHYGETECHTNEKGPDKFSV